MRKLKLRLVFAIAIILPLAGCQTPEPPLETTQTTPGPRTSSGVSSSEAPDEPSPEESLAPRVEAVVSSHELATAAGVEILAAGGSAADASVAVAAVLSVVEPFYSSVLGGGTWALYYDADGRAVTSMNGVGPVGSEATLSDYRPRAGIPGMHQAIVPGAWDGWMLWLEAYGELELGDVLAPAIAVAREGYPVSTEMSFWLTRQEDRIRNSPVMASIYLPDGDLLAPGETVYQTGMADTFESLVAVYDDAVAEGHAAGIAAARDYFYRGPIADAIVSFSEENAGYLTEQDFAEFSAELVEPISIEYDELSVYQNPPNSQGIAMLEALNILEGFDFAGQSAGDAAVVHRQVEAIKLVVGPPLAAQLLCDS
ncbi:gamma-glutamyltransferase [Arthrobacter sp. H14]|uniref:gamma-glutamyltransferase n=1 Tax=Arthrobacter sp. H14 TaxID=1312959 RepID=UPI0004B02EA0|nr:gamma-glutamyltransferase [Arthrobacter sp. H14]